MSEDVTLNLDEFGQEALASVAGSGRRGSVAAAVRTALLYYLADRDAGRPAWRVRATGSDSRFTRRLRVKLDEDTWRALAGEAGRQGATPGALAVHAVMYYLADLDSGRLAASLKDALENPE
jgi:hypothetical protein